MHRQIRSAPILLASVVLLAPVVGCSDSREGGMNGMRVPGVQANTEATLPAASSPAPGTEVLTEGPADGKPKP